MVKNAGEKWKFAFTAPELKMFANRVFTQKVILQQQQKIYI
jgi:hypothetical protein